MATAGAITFSDVSATNLMQADGKSDSDPYVRWSLTGGSTMAETHFLRNVIGRRGRTPGSERTPRWDSEYTADMPYGLDKPLTMVVSLWDSDRGEDDPLGDATFEVALTSTEQHFTLQLGNVPKELGSTVSFTVTVDLPMRQVSADEVVEASSAPPEAVSKPVVRKEIRSMSPEEQQRYAKAVKMMMQDSSGPESSEFFRLAGYHGWPGKGTLRNYSYCEHRQETFPGWHRAYLLAFEQALQAADRQLGNDGAIGLPYWDVLSQPEINGQTFPAILAEHFPNGVDVPRGLLADPSVAGESGAPQQRRRLWDRGYAIASDRSIKHAVIQERLGERAAAALWVQQHYRAASTYGSSNKDSVETPHDLVHVLCGFPMASLMHAAFHPLFWLHHCNIDRLYEAYLSNNPDSRREFEANQERSRFVNRKKGGRVDRFDEWLEPFELPTAHVRAGEKFYPRHTFDTVALGYRYDELLERPMQSMTAYPVFAVFEAIDINSLPSSYALHAFVYPKEMAGEAPPLGPTLDAILDDKFYGGLGGVFAGRADVCTNCQNSDPFDVRIDVSTKLTQLGLSAETAIVKVVAMDEEDVFMPLEETNIPPPTLKGGGAPFTPDNDDFAASNDAPAFKPASVVTYCVEEAPGYLSRGVLLNEIAQCFVAWAGPTASGLTFKRVSKADEAMLTVAWADHSATNPKKFDGPGGKLAEADASRIVFDSAERWLLHGIGWEHLARKAVAPDSPPCFFLAPVLLHEIGHSIGLTHSSDVSEVMAPHYDPDKVTLTPGDRARARAAYGVPEPVDGGGAAASPSAGGGGMASSEAEATTAKTGFCALL